MILCLTNLFFQTSSVRKYVLCERWKKVDRPLRHSALVLNIWNAWGQDKSIVRWVKEILRTVFNISIFYRFVLKRIKKERKPAARTNSKLWRKQKSGANSDTR